MYRPLASLTAEETEEVAQLVEMAAMKAWVERERAKARAAIRPNMANCVREIGLSRAVGKIHLTRFQVQFNFPA
jgi:hypothetical protein